MPEIDNQEALNPVERISAFTTLRDTEVLAQSPNHERLATVHDLMIVVLVWVLQVVLWSTAFATYGIPVLAAIPAGMLIATLIALLDIKLLSSDTAPRGVYRRGPVPRAQYWLLGMRLFISFMLASVTATALDCVVFRQEALQVIGRETSQRNVPIIANYNARLATLRAQEVGPIENEISRLTQERTKALAEVGETRAKIAAAYDQSASAELEREREENGVGRLGGVGRLAKDAEKRRQLAIDERQFLESRQKELGQTVEDLTQRIANANARLAQAQPRYAVDARKLETEREAQLLKTTTGPLSALKGVNKLRSDPEDGDTVWMVTAGAWAFVMTLELAYFLARAVFRPASFHDLAINADLRRRAVRLAHEEEAELRAARQRRPLRVVGEGEEADAARVDPAGRGLGAGPHDDQAA